MKINWKLRMQNPTFWVHVAVSVFVPIFTHFGVNWSQMTSWPTLFAIVAQALQNPVVVVAMAVSVWNCIIDPTTKGLSDGSSVLGMKTRSQLDAGKQ